MKIKLPTYIFAIISLIFFAHQNTVAQRKPLRKQRNVSQNLKNKSEKTIQVESIGDNIVLTINKLSVIYTSPRQNISIAAKYTTENPNTVDLLIVSTSSSFQYAGSSYTSILVDGTQLLSKNYQAQRGSYTDDYGNAIELLTVPIELSEFEVLQAARRVDIELNFFTKFSINYESRNRLSQLFQKITSVANVINTKNQKAEEERIAREDILSKEKQKREAEEAEEAERRKCRLTKEQSPTIKGFRLGTSIQSIIARLGITNTDQWNLSRTIKIGGVDVLVLNYLRLDGSIPNTEDFQFVNDIHLQFLDGKLYLYRVRYDNSEMNLWKDTDSFVEVISKNIMLPPLTRGKNSDTLTSVFTSYLDSSSANCDGWGLELTGTKEMGEIKVIDTVAKNNYIKLKEEKKRSEEELKRNIFKPN